MCVWVCVWVFVILCFNCHINNSNSLIAHECKLNFTPVNSRGKHCFTWSLEFQQQQIWCFFLIFFLRRVKRKTKMLEFQVGLWAFANRRRQLDKDMFFVIHAVTFKAESNKKNILHLTVEMFFSWVRMCVCVCGVCYTAGLQSTSTKCCLLSLINNETDVTPDTTGELSLL